MKSPFLSIIIPTLNRQVMLEQTISFLVKTQNLENYELLIIDQSDNYNISQEETQLRSIIQDKVELKYFSANFKSLTKARNFAIKVALGEILLFLDDDIVPYPDLTSEHIKSYQVAENVGCVAGMVIEEPDVFTNTKRTGAEVDFTGRCLRNFRNDGSGFIKAAPGGNMSFRKRVIEKVGLFDERFIGTSELEETDYCYRVRKANYKILYNSRAKIMHLINPSGGCRSDFEDRQFYKMHNLGLFFSKHKSWICVPIMLLFQFITILIRTNRNVKKQYVKTSLQAFRGLLVGYFQTSRLKENNKWKFV